MISGTYHHIYNRGAHKAPIFKDGADYLRMLKLLYVSNDESPFKMRKLPENVFAVERKSPLVEIVAYCLMPNHIHIALRSRSGLGNISRFMHKLSTGYVSYFNRKYDHSGTIWQGPYKEKAVYDERYLNTLIQYIHLNPYGIKEPEMTKEARLEHMYEALDYSSKYEYSSYKEHLGAVRPQSAILDLSQVRPGPTDQA